MSNVDNREQATKYRFQAEWNKQDGWHFSFGTKRLWEGKDKYIVADLMEKDGREQFCNHENFENMREALDYMRMGKR